MPHVEFVQNPPGRTDSDSKAHSHDDVGANKASKNDANTKESVMRVVTVVDMDYEQGIMKITDHNVEASDFSPLENSSLAVDDKTSQDGDSEILSTHNDFTDTWNEQVDTTDSHEELKLDIDTSAKQDIQKCNHIFSKTEDKNHKMSTETCSNDKIPLTCNDPDSAHISIIEQGTCVYKFYGCFTPFGAKCRPEIYGFRGPLYVWSEAKGRYSLIYNDGVTVASLHERQLPADTASFHQAYTPRTVCRLARSLHN